MSPTPRPVLGMILKGYPRISETFISNEISLLENLGFQIHLFSMRQPREKFTHDSVKHIQAAVDYLPETLLKPLPRLIYHNLCLAAKNPKVYGAALKTAYRRFLRTRKSATLKHLLQAGYLVHRLLPASGVTHLHAHFAHSPTSVAMFTSRLTGIPFSFTAHAKDIYTSDPRQIREKIGLARFVVTCTEYNRKHLRELGDGHTTPIHRNYHGIDTRFFSTNPEAAKLPVPPFQILTIARLTAKKGLPTIYQALRILRDQGIALRHTHIGGGEDRELIMSLIKKLDLESVTELLGTQPHEVVLDHYRDADLFVLGCEVAPNGDRDGIPNVLAESMAMGLPVVATRISGIPELVEHERTGLLVPPGRPAKLAQSMLRLLTDEALRNRCIAAGKQKVGQIFDNRQLIRELAGIYHQEGLGPGV
ncbi:Glycosyl transferase, group 1 family protein [Olavius algarvensis Delta 1 endosymbiont]|nr:Glycosyl transferase, group 1 family protein [Olavius algarvensis Delta 1 endosymbiont]